MLSIRNPMTMLIALFLLALTGCGGNEEPAEAGNDAWSTKGNDLQAKLAAVKEGHEALNTQLYTMPAAASTDSAVVAARTSIEQALNDQATKVGDIETMLSAGMDQRDKLRADGDDDAYKTAWTAEEERYNAAMSTLDSIQKLQPDLKKQIDNLATIAASPSTTGDSSGLTNMPSMPEMKDSGSTGNIDTGATLR